jgi:hypothetical protein
MSHLWLCIVTPFGVHTRRDTKYVCVYIIVHRCGNLEFYPLPWILVVSNRLVKGQDIGKNGQDDRRNISLAGFRTKALTVTSRTL